MAKRSLDPFGRSSEQAGQTISFSTDSAPGREQCVLKQHRLTSLGSTNMFGGCYRVGSSPPCLQTKELTLAKAVQANKKHEQIES